jgi:EmrB/QacA subfamily drug resistance transporter
MHDALKKQSNDVTVRRVALIVSAIAAFIAAMNMNAVNVAIPVIGNQLEMKAVLLVWITNSVMFVSAILFIPFGSLADMFGRKKIFLFGFIVNAVSGFLCATAGTGTSLIVYRVMQGVAGAMTLGTSVALITSVFPIEERGKALGINAAALYMGIASGPSIGGILTQQLGWRSLFYVFGILCLLVVLLVVWKLKGEWVGVKSEKLDVPGMIAITLSLGCILGGFTYLPSIFAIVMIILGIIGMVIFVFIERRTKFPVLDFDVFKGNRTFAFSNMAITLNYIAMSAITFFASLYLQYIKGFSPQTAGFILLVQPVVITVFAIISGRLSDRIAPQLIASTGMLFTCISMALLYTLNQGTDLWFIIFCLALTGLSQGLFTTPNIHAIMSSVDTEYSGSASGIMSTTRGIGMVLGLGTATIAFNHFIGDVQLTPGYYHEFMTSMKLCFFVASIAAFLGMLSQYACRDRKLSVES